MTTGGLPPIKSADRTVELLELLAAIPDRRTLVELARDLSIPKSSLHGLLRTLVHRGWVETDTAGLRYGLGVRALRTGTAYLRIDRAVRRLTQVIDALHRHLDTTVQLGRLVDGQMVCLLSRDTANAPAALRPGWPTPAHTTAMGRAVLARAAVDDRTLTQLLPAATTLPDDQLTALHDELRRTRERGHAVDWAAPAPNGHCGIAVPAPAKLGPLDAIGVSIADRRLTAARADELVTATIAAINTGLTGRP